MRRYVAGIGLVAAVVAAGGQTSDAAVVGAPVPSPVGTSVAVAARAAAPTNEAGGARVAPGSSITSSSGGSAAPSRTAGSARPSAAEVRAAGAAATAALAAPRVRPARGLDRGALLLPVSGLYARPAATSVALAWTDPIDPSPASVVVVRAAGRTAPTSPTDGTRVATSSATSAVDTTVAPSTSYAYAVFAETAQGAYAAATTVVTTTIAATATAAPSAVTDLATNASSTSVVLTWSASTVGLTDVIIRRAAGATPPSSATAGTSVADVPAPVATWVDSRLTASTTYAYAVFAHGPGGTSPRAVATAVTRSTTPGACTDTWTGAGGSSWDTAASWSSGQVPGSHDWACVPAGTASLPATVSQKESVAGLTVTGSVSGSSGGITATDTTRPSSVTGSVTLTAFASASELVVSGRATIGTLGGRLTAGPGASLVLSATSAGAAVDVDGSLAVGGAVLGLQLGADATLAVPGTLQLGTSGEVLPVLAGAPTPAPATVVLSGTVVGSGQIGGVSPQFGGGGDLALTTLDSAAWSVPSGTGYGEGTFQVMPAATFSGPGTLGLSGDTVIDRAGLQVTQPLVIAGQVSGGNLTSTDSLELDGSWAGPGTLTAAAGSTAVVGVQRAYPGETDELAGGAFVNAGTLSDDEPARGEPFRIAPGGLFYNTGSVSMGLNGRLAGDCGNVPADQPALFVSVGQISFSSDGEDGGGSVGEPVQGSTPACLRSILGGGFAVPSGDAELDGQVDLVPGFAFTGTPGSGTLELHDGIRIDLASLAVPYAVSLTASSESAPTPPTLSGSADVEIDRSLELDGTWADTGTLDVVPGATLSVTTAEPDDFVAQLDGGPVRVDGAAHLGVDEDLLLDPGVDLVTTGAVELDGGSALLGGCPADSADISDDPVFVSTGSITTQAVDPSSGHAPTSIGAYVQDLQAGCLDAGVLGALHVGGTLDLTAPALVLGPAATVDGGSGATLRITDGGGVLAEDSSLLGVGAVDDDGLLVADADLALPAFDVTGGFELGPDVAATATSATLGSGSAIADEAGSPGSWGSLTVAGAVDLSGAKLLLEADGFVPTCGTTVDAVEAAPVSNGFGSATGTPVPAGATWQPSSTTTSAGATLTC